MIKRWKNKNTLQHIEQSSVLNVMMINLSWKQYVTEKSAISPHKKRVVNSTASE